MVNSVLERPESKLCWKDEFLVRIGIKTVNEQIYERADIQIIHVCSGIKDEQRFLEMNCIKA